MYRIRRQGKSDITIIYGETQQGLAPKTLRSPTSALNPKSGIRS